MAEKTIEIDLSRAVRLDELSALGLAFLRWWGAELVEALPAALRDALPRRKQTTRISLAGDLWRIARNEPATAASQIDATYDDRELRAALLAVVPDICQTRIAVVLPGSQVLIRRLQLPMIGDARVRPAVELQIDRLTPFKPENVRFACRVLERRIEENDMSVEVAVVPSQAFATMEARLVAVGIKPDVIDVAGSDGNGLGFNLRDEGGTALSRRYRLMNFGLAAGAAFTWLMAYYAVGAAGEAEIARWQARIVELRPQAQHSSDLANAIEALAQPLEIAKSRTHVTTLDVLKELTRVLPDSSHLFELRLSGDGLEASGLAQNAPALIEKLGASKLFSEAHFRAPVTRPAGVAQDRFEIALKIKGGSR